jgi:hypothetical protein
MGNSDSNLAHGHLSEEHLAESETLGYRVLGVQPNSPASSAGLVSFLDFLVGCEEQMLLSNDDDVPDVDFVQLLKDSVGKELELCKLCRPSNTNLRFADDRQYTVLFSTPSDTSFHLYCSGL